MRSCIAPIGIEEARRLVGETDVISRAVSPAAAEAIAAVVVALGRIAAEHPEISAIDVNPLIVDDEGAVAVDALVESARDFIDAVLLERRGPAAWLTLNRPDKLNAMNGEMVRELRDQLAAIEGDDSVKVVVLTGAGRAFSAGYDISEEVTDRIVGADQWRAVLAARRRAGDAAVGSVASDDRRGQRLVPCRRLRARDGLRHDRVDRRCALRRARDPVRLGAGGSA